MKDKAFCCSMWLKEFLKTFKMKQKLILYSIVWSSFLDIFRRYCFLIWGSLPASFWEVRLAGSCVDFWTHVKSSRTISVYGSSCCSSWFTEDVGWKNSHLRMDSSWQGTKRGSISPGSISSIPSNIQRILSTHYYLPDFKKPNANLLDFSMMIQFRVFCLFHLVALLIWRFFFFYEELRSMQGRTRKMD